MQAVAASSPGELMTRRIHVSPKGEAGELKQPSTAGVAVPASGAQGLLFTEDLPVLDEDA